MTGGNQCSGRFRTGDRSFQPVAFQRGCFVCFSKKGPGRHRRATPRRRDQPPANRCLVFSPDEMEVLQNLPTENLRTVFYQFWTRKEAYIKALGKGFSAPLNSNRRTPGARKTGVAQRTRLTRTSDWFVRDLYPCPGYAAAVATKGTDRQFLFYNFET